jgi:hypothetical protein
MWFTMNLLRIWVFEAVHSLFGVMHILKLLEQHQSVFKILCPTFYSVVYIYIYRNIVEVFSDSADNIQLFNDC